ncbi:MAG: hypothetical protein QOH31_5042 [Verrucomicrobiota bacterium]
MKSGTRISRPVSSLAHLVTLPLDGRSTPGFGVGNLQLTE